MITQNMTDLNRLSKGGAGTLATGLGDVRGQVNQIAGTIQQMVNAFSSMRDQNGGDKLVRNVEVGASWSTASTSSAVRWASASRLPRTCSPGWGRC